MSSDDSNAAIPLQRAAASFALLAAVISLATNAAARPPASGKHAADEDTLVHAPVTAQAVKVPIPLYVEVPPDVEAKKVRVRYRRDGDAEWKSLDMKPLAAGFSARIPCADVGQIGQISYYLQALDVTGEVVGASGSRTTPHRDRSRRGARRNHATASAGKAPPRRLHGSL